MVKRKYPGAYYPVSKRGRYTRRRRTRRRTAYRGRRRTYRRSIMSGVGEVKTIHAQENFTLRSSDPAERVENWDIVPINTMAWFSQQPAGWQCYWPMCSSVSLCY